MYFEAVRAPAHSEQAQKKLAENMCSGQFIPCRVRSKDRTACPPQKTIGPAALEINALIYNTLIIIYIKP